MTTDCLKLTTYFGEHDRGQRGLIADELLDLYGRQEMQISVLVRGIEGFGLRHHLRTDRLLTLSEDLPLASVAVDTSARITDLLGEVRALKHPGLVTLERARMLTGGIGNVQLPEDLHEATKLTLYLGRHERAGGTAAFVAVCDLLHRCGIAGATVLLGVDGTVGGQRARARFFGRNAGVPMMIIAVGSAARLASALAELGPLLPRALVTLERVQVCKRDGELLARPSPVAGRDPSGLPVWQKLMIYTSEDAQERGAPIHVALVRALRHHRARGATSLRGVWGFHGEHAPHGDRLLQLRRRVPVVTIVVDSPERIAGWFDVVDELTGAGGLVTSELVPAAVAVEDHGADGELRLARPEP